MLKMDQTKETMYGK